MLGRERERALSLNKGGAPVRGWGAPSVQTSDGKRSGARGARRETGSPGRGPQEEDSRRGGRSDRSGEAV